MSHTVLRTYTWTVRGESHTVNIIEMENPCRTGGEIYEEILSDEDYRRGGFEPITKDQLRDLENRYPRDMSGYSIACGLGDEGVAWCLHSVEGWLPCSKEVVFDERFHFAIVAICGA